MLFLIFSSFQFYLIILFLLCLILAFILLVPIPYRIKDGGSILYDAILYSVKDVKMIHPDPSKSEYIEGVIVEILGFEVYNNVDDWN